MKQCSHLQHLNTLPMYTALPFRLSTRAAIFTFTLLPLLENSRSNAFVNVLTIVLYYYVRCVVIFLLRKLPVRMSWILPDAVHPDTLTLTQFCFFPANVSIMVQFPPVEGKRDGATKWKPTGLRLLLPVWDSAVSLLINWVSDGGFALSRVPVLHMWHAGDGKYSRYSSSLFFLLVFPVKSAVHLSAMCWWATNSDNKTR